MSKNKINRRVQVQLPHFVFLDTIDHCGKGLFRRHCDFFTIRVPLSTLLLVCYRDVI